MAVAKAFVLFSMPFVPIEVATGMISLVTGYLSILPAVGLSTGVEMVILVAVLSVAFYKGTRSSPSEADVMEDEEP